MKKEKVCLIAGLFLVVIITLITRDVFKYGESNIANPLEKSEEVARIEGNESIGDLEKISSSEIEKLSFASKVVESVTNFFNGSKNEAIIENYEKDVKEDIFSETVNKYLLKSKTETTFMSSRGISTVRAIYPPLNLLGVGDLYVAGDGGNNIQKFTSTGSYITQWGSQGTGNGQFFNPVDVATDSVGNVYVVDNQNNRIQKFTSTGTYITQWGSAGVGNGQFNHPWGLAIDSSDYIYVADSENNRIQKFTSTGAFITEWGILGTGNGQFNFPTQIAVDNSNNIYVTDQYNDRIQKFTSTGTYITQWGSLGTASGQFDKPSGIGTDSGGNVYISDTINNRIQKFTSTGTYITQWGSLGTASGQFDDPHGITIDTSDDVYIVDRDNHRVQKFDSNGNYIIQWGNLGAGNGQFQSPMGIDFIATFPDLVVDSISAPSIISVGATTDNPFYPNIGFPINPAPPVPIDVTIKNIGNADAIIPANMSITMIIHCPDYTLCGWPSFGANNFNFMGFKHFQIGAALTLPPGGTHTVQADSFFHFNPYSAPYSGTTTYTGPMNLWAIVDTVDGYLLNNNLINESNESNNMGPHLPITVIQ